MGLKQNIVVVNEYTIKTGSKGGSRGGSPGAYVERYMSRKGATEGLTPIRLTDNEHYIKRYMARKSATETLDSLIEVKEQLAEGATTGLGGVAFGQFSKYDDGDISMSDRTVRKISKDIQKEFDNGKTCMKTVLSFDEEYLRSMNIIDETFACKSEGDYKGNIDQMKLRIGIMNGMKKMGRQFDDLMWTGVIQVDTKHVHCHLCMVDKGTGRIAVDGTQKGKLSQKEMQTLRRGVDDTLNELSPIKAMASNITNDRRNAKCFIKQFTHRTMSNQGNFQFLVACLPDDKRLWRASTNRAEMKKPNAIIREYVAEVLDQPGSGYKEALRDINEYARYRYENEDLSQIEYRRLLKDGQERLFDDCVNSVYAVLKDIPNDEKRVKTPMLDVMGMSYDEMASHLGSDPMIEFGFKLRSYSSRLEHHRKEYTNYHNARENYEAALEAGNVSEDSQALYAFYKNEETYNEKLMCKYQHFLSFIPPKRTYETEFNDVVAYQAKLHSLKQLRNDKSLKRMDGDNAEEYGVKVYGMHGGRLVKNSADILDNRIAQMTDTFTKKVDTFQFNLATHGLSLHLEDEDEEDKATTIKVSTKKLYPFDDVKALDLHHLGYDFPYDAPISQVNADEFIAESEQRYTCLQNARDYLTHSKQAEYIETLPVNDIEIMKALADSMRTDPVLHSNKADSSVKVRRSHTVELGHDYEVDLKLAIKATINATQLGEK